MNDSYQFRSVLSNFARFFPTSLGSFQLKEKLFNFRLSNFSLFLTGLSIYAYPLVRSNWKFLRLNFAGISSWRRKFSHFAAAKTRAWLQKRMIMGFYAPGTAFNLIRKASLEMLPNNENWRLLSQSLMDRVPPFVLVQILFRVWNFSWPD